jgi:CO dehydrogenase maturation factor
VSIHIAVVGKGGSGKSVLAGSLARILARRGHRVLTLDSDPMPGLSLNLGLGIDGSAMLLDAVEKDEAGRWRLRKGIGPVRAIRRYAVTAPDGVRHLQLGKMGDEGQPAIQGSMSGYTEVVRRLYRTSALGDWTIIGDLAAGPRHVVFELAPYANTFVLMVEPSLKSALTARRLTALIRSRPGPAVMPVASKVRGPQDRDLVESMLGAPVAAAIPVDPAIRLAERTGLAPFDYAPDSPAMREIESLADALESANRSETPFGVG